MGAELQNLHPYLRNQTPQQLSNAIPVTWFEDAGPFSKSKSMSVIAWSGLLATSHEGFSKFVAAMCVKTATTLDHEYDACRAILADFAALAVGHCDGEPLLRDGEGQCWRVILLFAKGDLEQKVRWGAVDYNSTNEVCFFHA